MQELDLTPPSTAQRMHWVSRMIESQYQSLLHYIYTNMGFYDKANAHLDQLESAAIENLYEHYPEEAKGIIEYREEEIRSKFRWEREIIFYSENDSYHAALIMAFSYFESLIDAICLAKNKAPGYKVGPGVDNLLNNYGLAFSPNINEIYRYLVDELRVVRNFLTHNYNTNTRVINDVDKSDPEEKVKIENYLNKYLDDFEYVKREADRKIGLSLIDNDKLDKSAITVIINHDYVEQALNKIYSVLSELAKILDLNKAEEQTTDQSNPKNINKD